MGVEPFFLSSSLLGVLAQRLVRHLCEECKRPKTADVAECVALGVPAENPPTIYEPVGCDACNQQGYKGRSGIYELIEIDDTFRQMIHDGAGEHELETHARVMSPSIRRDGIRRVLSGDTSLEEVLRVTHEEV